MQRHDAWCKQQRNQNFPARLSQPLPSHQRSTRPCVILMHCYAFFVNWSQVLFVECCLQLVLLGAVLVGINTLVCQKELILEGSLPIPPYTPHHLLWNEEDRSVVWLVVVHFSCPMISSIPHYCQVSTFHRPSQFVLKTECFHYM